MAIRELCLNVLGVALNDLAIIKKSKIRGVKRCRDSRGYQFGVVSKIYPATLDWFASEEEILEGGLSFALICEFLAIDKNIIRNRIVEKIKKASTVDEVEEIKRKHIATYLAFTNSK